MPMDDAQLLRSYAVDRSEEAFRDLVRRHAAIVHGVARRQPGIDPHLADDVTQRVFIALARKANALCEQPTLVGWLYLAARLEAARVVRSEARRRTHEEKADDMIPAHADDSAGTLSWSQLRPVLDDAMAQLRETDRNAVLLRFFSGQSFADIGRVFQISDEAARKRVDRAVDQLRQHLSRRGMVSTSSALSLALGSHAAPIISEETLTTIAQAAFQQASTSSAISIGLYMSSTKVTAVIASAVILLTGTLVILDSTRLREAEESNVAGKAELASLARYQANLERELASVRQQYADELTRQRATTTSAPDAARPYLLDPVYRELSRRASQARRHLEFQRRSRETAVAMSRKFSAAADRNGTRRCGLFSATMA